MSKPKIFVRGLLLLVAYFGVAFAIIGRGYAERDLRLLAWGYAVFTGGVAGFAGYLMRGRLGLALGLIIGFVITLFIHTFAVLLPSAT